MNLTIKSIVRYLGGPTLISKRLAEKGENISPSAVSKWGHLKNIPIKYWPHLIEMAADMRPLTNDDLVAAHTRAK